MVSILDSRSTGQDFEEEVLRLPLRSQDYDYIQAEERVSAEVLGGRMMMKCPKCGNEDQAAFDWGTEGLDPAKYKYYILCLECNERIYVTIEELQKVHFE